MEPRKLRMLVIDDEVKNFTMSYKHVDNIMISTYSGGGSEKSSVSSMGEALKIFGSNDFPDFDLLAIDKRFGDDLSDPPYHGELLPTGVYNPSAVNPIGLLWGQAFACAQIHRKLPFGSATYSGGANVLSKDCVAIICFSILRALQGYDFAAMGLEEEQIRDFISDELYRMPNEDIGDAADRMMKSYHRDLIKFARSGGIQRENIASLVAACRKIIGCSAAKQNSEMSKLTVHLNTNYEQVRIILRSIFFAVEISDSGLTDVVIPFLEEILNAYDESASKLYEMVELALENVNFRPGEVKADMQLHAAIDKALSTIAGEPNAPAKCDVIVGMIVCSILVAGPKLDKKTINLRVKQFIGAEGNDNGINRALRSTVGLDSAFHTFGRFLSMILLKGGRSLPAQFKQCGRKYADTLKIKVDSIPAFLRDQTA